MAHPAAYKPSIKHAFSASATPPAMAACAKTHGTTYTSNVTVSDWIPSWLLKTIGGKAGDGLDNLIDNTDAFAAGMSSTVTGGLTDKVRAGIYGSVADQSDNGFYTAGQIAGIAPAIATGVLTGAGVGHVGNLVKAAKTISTVETVHAFATTANKAIHGESLGWEDVANFAPAGLAGVSRLRKWVQCFEGDTAVAIDWNAAPDSTLVVASSSISLGIVRDNLVPEAESSRKCLLAGITVICAAGLLQNAVQARRKRKSRQQRLSAVDAYFSPVTYC